MKKFLLLILSLISIYGCNLQQSAKELEIKRISDSIRVADSLAMVMAEQQRIADSISGVGIRNGIWVIKNYVDEFETKTDKKYITTESNILGTFSNSATENSELEVRLLIDNSEKVAIKLFEYAGKNPVKAGIEEGYKIKVKPPNSEAVVLIGRNSSDRLELDKSDSKKLTTILCDGGKIQFYIIDITEYAHSSYRFEIDNADGFDKILAALQNKN
jgi:hypothetical protein